MAASPAPVRWGFLSTANITKKNAAAIAASPSSALVAVASRDLARAAAWRDAEISPAAAPAVALHGSYEALLADSAVEAVYIPLPTTLRREWVERAAAAGKHVLVEKPAAGSLADARAMVASCRAAGRVLLDGVMFMHHRRLAAMAAHITPLRAAGGAGSAASDETEIGAIRRVVCGFTFPATAEFMSSNIRVKKELEPMGAIGDLGWYCARFSLWAFGYESPTHASCVAHASTEEGVPLDATATLYFTGGRTATFDCGFTTSFRQWGEVVGTTGRLTVDDFVIARSHASASYTLIKGAAVVDKHRSVSDSVTTVDVRDCNQEAAMFERASALVRAGAAGGGDGGSGGGEEARPEFWSRLLLQTQAIMDACMASIEADRVRRAASGIGAAAASETAGPGAVGGVVVEVEAV